VKAPAIQPTGPLKQDLAGGIGLVEFCVPWSAPCREQKRILATLARRFQERAWIARINVDENEEVAREFGIESLPTLVIFKDQREVRRFLGLHAGNVISKALGDLVGDAS
jgi:thioredoxin 1